MPEAPGGSQREKRSRVATKRGKTATKTARSPINGAEIPLGAHPGNTGGKPGRSGRKPDAFRELCRALASGETTVQQVEAILKDNQHPAFLGAVKWATEHGYGKPTEHVEHSGTVNHKHQVWKFGDKEVAF